MKDTDVAGMYSRVIARCRTSYDGKEQTMMKYAGLLIASVAFVALTAGCQGGISRIQDPPVKACCVTLEFTFVQEVALEEGGGALEDVDLMRLTQRVNLGGEFEIHDEKRISYIDDIDGIEVPVSGVRLFSINGSTKMLGDSHRFLLEAELRYIDESAKIDFIGKPSAILALDSDEPVTITESGPMRVMLKVTAPDEMEYVK